MCYFTHNSILGIDLCDGFISDIMFNSTFLYNNNLFKYSVYFTTVLISWRFIGVLAYAIWFPRSTPSYPS